MPLIRQYTKQDGTVVREHRRAPAGTARETALAVGVVVAVAVFGNTGAPAGGGASAEGPPGPRPSPRVAYPIEWPGWDRPVPRPTPTVSYPVRWDRSGGGR
ncbi:hypothetical protein LUX01_00595 [Streptomyces sudanensis]|uniref:hypothetical protein n=1 Tax=Streptomyces sudanensis TaxID=436397 RepID=UPI00029B23F4|nr:hypothetical protein [Streptomyces sudanensis]MCP9985415.1 hypothetical protein [Streptomyces sudanensis]